MSPPKEYPLLGVDDFLEEGYYALDDTCKVVVKVKPGRPWTVHDAVAWIMFHGGGWRADYSFKELDPSDVKNTQVVVLGEE